MYKLFFLFALVGCAQPADHSRALQSRMDSLEVRLANAYKPGLGEFMGSMQVHHAKLWFAGQNQNWELADFEIKEIKEALEDISQYCTDRPEIKEIGIIEPAIDSLSQSIQTKNLASFNRSFVLLTNTCNECHQATAHAFNVIKVPDHPPFGNQEFKLK